MEQLTTFEMILGIALGICLILILIDIIMTQRFEKKTGLDEDRFQTKLQMALGETTQKQIITLGNYMTQNQGEQFKEIHRQLESFSNENGRTMESYRKTMEERLRFLQNDNNIRLDEMRKIVDEKLQKTINERMNESFKLVNERLEQVYRGLGEMQSLAQGVGDLKKVLSNVKNRGILGEVQLGAILEDILSPGQYEKNINTVPNSTNVVEYAVKLPVEDGSFIFLPIDAKFPGETYGALRDAYDRGSPEEIQAISKQLIQTIQSEAKDIHDKYICPPYTTDFAVMFLPFEGLYSEVVNRGMVEVLQKKFRVNIAGPSTMAALLNSLQMSFRTIAIQKRSGEVWEVLGAVKTEFGNFENALLKAQNHLRMAGSDIDDLVGKRTRAIQRKLKDVESLSLADSQNILTNYDAEMPIIEYNSEDMTQEDEE